MVSPKKAAKGTEGGFTEEGMKIISLCTLIMKCDQFTVNATEVAPLLGVTHPKNVARKLNGMIGPYGFEYKGGKFTKKDDAGASGAELKENGDENTGDAGPAAAATAAAKGGEQADAGAKTAPPASKKQTPTKGKKATAASTPASKKRKLDDDPDAGDDDEGEVQDEHDEHAAEV